MTSPHDAPLAALRAPDVVRAYVDGELDAALRAQLEAALPRDAALQAAVARERRLRETLAAAYGPVLDEPVPQALQQALLRSPPAPASPSAPAVVALASARRAGAATAAMSDAPRRGTVQDTWWRWGGMAACVVVGVLAGVLGRSLWTATGPAQLAQLAPTAQIAQIAQAPSPADHGLLLQGAVAQALTQQLASQPAASEGEVAVGLSFQARDGSYCRTFTTPGVDAVSGVACRMRQGWQLQALAPAATASHGLRTASSSLPLAVLQAVDSLRQGDTLDANAEAAVRARGWRP